MSQLNTNTCDRVTCYKSCMTAKIYESAAARQAAWRKRQGTPVQVMLNPDLVVTLDAYIARAALSDPTVNRSKVIAKLLERQLLRKR